MRSIIRTARRGALVALAATALQGASPVLAQEPVRVIATLPVFAKLAKAIGGERVEVAAIASPIQDPHFVDAKPRYIVEAGRADVFIEAGMDLEVSWAPLVREQSRNATIQMGGAGWLDASGHVRKLGVPVGRVDRSRGDVHPYGNPHYWLDPLNAVPLTADIALALSRVDPANAGLYNDRRREFLAALDRRMDAWRREMAPLRGTPIVSYHESWEYFANRFGLEILGHLEPKPGIPPSPSHLARLMDRMKARKAELILQEPYYEERNPRLVARETGATVVRIRNQPEEDETYLEFMDYIVDTILSAARGAGAPGR